MRWLLAMVLVFFGAAGCIPPAGFARARTPTPALPTLSAADLCEDYVRDVARANRELRQEIAGQIADVSAASVGTAKPPDDLAARIAQRRLSLVRSAETYQRPALCPQGEPGRLILAGLLQPIREANDFLNLASETDRPADYAKAIEPYRRALLVLNQTPAP